MSIELPPHCIGGDNSELNQPMYNEINHGFVYLSSTLSHCFALVVIIFKHLGMVIHRINRLSGRAISIKFARYIKCHLSAKLHTCLLMQYNCLSTTQYILLSNTLSVFFSQEGVVVGDQSLVNTADSELVRYTFTSQIEENPDLSHILDFSSANQCVRTWCSFKISGAE